MSGKPYFGLLLSNFGHLYSVLPLGLGLYWKFWAWDAVGWGNVGFVLPCRHKDFISQWFGLGLCWGKESTIQSQAAYITLTSLGCRSEN